MELRPRLFEMVHIPSAVYDELRHPSTPDAVRSWINSRPAWLEISAVLRNNDPSLGVLDEGERAAIALGLSVSADLILVDDRRGAAAARQKALKIRNGGFACTELPRSQTLTGCFWP